MPVLATRLHRPTPGTVNQGNQKSDSIVYRVTGQTFAQSKADVFGRLPIEGLPGIFTGAHPDFPEMLCRQHTVAALGGGENAIVTALFATSNFPGAGLLRAVPDVSGSQFVLSCTFEEVAVTLPGCLVGRYAIVLSGGSTVTKERWKVTTKKVSENRMILRAKWTLAGVELAVSDLEKFGEQSNKLHTINGKVYRYRVGSITPLDNFTYEVNATWEYDPGTPRIVPDGGSSDLGAYLLTQDLPYMPDEDGDPLLIRDPFHALNVVPAENPDASLLDRKSQPRLSQIPLHLPGDITKIPGVPI